MAAPSKSYTAITDGQVDAESPIDVTLMTAIRDNLVHLEEWLGLSYTAAQDHDHDGVNSKAVKGSITASGLVESASGGSSTSGELAACTASSVGTPATGVLHARAVLDISTTVNITSADITSVEIQYNGSAIGERTISSIVGTSSDEELHVVVYGRYENTSSPQATTTADLKLVINGTVGNAADSFDYAGAQLQYEVYN